MERKDVYKLIDGERDYQNEKWNEDTTITKNIHTPEEWMMYIQDYLTEAIHIISREAAQTGRPKAMENVRKIAGLCVAAMEDNETLPRKV